MHFSSLDSRRLLVAFSKPRGKVAIVGNRDFTRWEWVVSLVGLIPLDWTILSRGCAGVDAWVEAAALSGNWAYESRRPDWEKHYRLAPLARNRQLVDDVDWVIAFWDGASGSLNDLLAKARKQNKLLHTFVDDGD